MAQSGRRTARPGAGSGAGSGRRGEAPRKPVRKSVRGAAGDPAVPAPRITVAAFAEVCQELAFQHWWGFRVERIDYGRALLRQPIRPEFHRPGGIVGGPILFGVVDAAMYAAVLSVAGPVKMATTTDISIRFLRQASGRELVIDARVIKAGKRLVVCEVAVLMVGDPMPVVHATGTYSVPSAPKT